MTADTTTNNWTAAGLGQIVFVFLTNRVGFNLGRDGCGLMHKSSTGKEFEMDLMVML